MEPTGQPPGRQTGRQTAGPAKPAAEPCAPARLTQSSVYRRVPAAVRCRLDQAIVLRPADCTTPEAIAEKFDLEKRYGVSLSVLRSYARKLEQFVRPAVASQFLAGVLGCLPESYRRQLVAGNQVLLLSRVVQALTAPGESGLPVSDLARLASLLSSFARQTRATPGPTCPHQSENTSEKKGPDTPVTDPDPTRLAEAVRTVYGLPWPPDAAGAAETPQ